MSNVITTRAKVYVDAENKHYEKKFGYPLSATEQSVAIMAYERGYRDAVHSALAIATYSEKNIIERLKDLEK